MARGRVLVLARVPTLLARMLARVLVLARMLARVLVLARMLALGRMLVLVPARVLALVRAPQGLRGGRLERS
jgi:hypothetical protein